MDPAEIRLAPMTDEMYHRYFQAYENDPDLLREGQAYSPYAYSKEAVDRYVRRQRDLGRIPLAILLGDEIVGEIILRDIEAHRSATLGIALKNAGYKDRGSGTQAERLAVQWAFHDLDIPTLFADTVRSNTRNQHVLEKVGFRLIREDRYFRYYRIDREPAP